jgi:RNA polymerase sigma-70 factor (ECF subfamily)
MGCNDALAVLFERHSALVFRTAGAILRDDREAEETVREVFMDVMKTVNQFDTEHRNFEAWLLRFAYDRSIDRQGQLRLDIRHSE